MGGDPKVAGSNVELVQAGVFSVSYAPFPQSNTSFVQIAPSTQPVNLPLCNLDTGSRVYAYADSNHNNDGFDYFFIENMSKNCYNGCYVHTTNTGIQDTCGIGGGSWANSDGATGECIGERMPGYDLAECVVLPNVKTA